MDFTNTQIIIILLLIIVFTFIYNYDVYVIVKNEPICKPVFVTKRTLDPTALNIINKEMTNELKQKVFDTNILEKFINYSPEIYENFVNSDTDGNLSIPDSSLLKLNIPEISTHYKKIVVDNIINVLANIPTNMSIENIKELIEYFSIIYQTSPDINTFFDHVAVSIKINQHPYNSSYAHLILYLIAKFDSIYTSSCMDVNCINNINDSEDELTNTKCNVRFSDKLKNETTSTTSMSNQLSKVPMSNQLPKVPMSNQMPKVPMSNQMPKVPMGNQMPKVPMSNQMPKVPMANQMPKVPMSMSNQSASKENFENIDSFNNNFTNFASF
jgi:hypothetical protein